MDCFKTLLLPEICKIPGKLERSAMHTKRPQTFVPISWMCTKQTGVSHSSAESYTFSFDASLRIEGIPALLLWDCASETFSHSDVTHTIPHKHRNIFMAMMNELEDIDKPRKNDGLRIQRAQEVRDYAARIRAGLLIFVGPGSKKDLEVRQVGCRQSVRRLGRKIVADSSNRPGNKTPSRPWHHFC